MALGITSLVLWIAFAEVLRRCFLVVWRAFTGPLSKVPGPLLNKLTPFPWIIANITGNSMHVGPKLFKKYGGVVRVAPDFIIVGDKVGVNQVMVEEDLQKSTVYSAINPSPDAKSMFTEIDKQVHRQKRRLLAPGFSISYLNSLEPLMADCVHALEGMLNAKCAEGNGSAVVDFSLALNNLTIDIMSATSFGGSFNLVASGDQRIRTWLSNRLLRVAVNAYFPFLKYLPFVPPIEAPEYTKMIDDILSRRRGAEKNLAKKDLLQNFLDANIQDPVLFSEKNVREEMAVFMMAGTDTTSATLTYSLLLLLNNQEKLKVLIEELNTCIPSINDPINFTNTDLPYLNAVLHESMRVMPIAGAGSSRITTAKTLIGGYEVPEGVTVDVYMSSMLKDERNFPDAEDFVPERWLGEYKGVKADREAFIPFSRGARNCIGQQFAWRELRIVVATLLRRYELSLVPGQSHEMKNYFVALLTQGFYNISVKPRVA